jgi:hypothetical protein
VCVCVYIYIYIYTYIFVYRNIGAGHFEQCIMQTHLSTWLHRHPIRCLWPCQGPHGHVCSWSLRGFRMWGFENQQTSMDQFYLSNGFQRYARSIIISTNCTWSSQSRWGVCALTRAGSLVTHSVSKTPSFYFSESHCSSQEKNRSLWPDSGISPG